MIQINRIYRYLIRDRTLQVTFCPVLDNSPIFLPGQVYLHHAFIRLWFKKKKNPKDLFIGLGSFYLAGRSEFETMAAIVSVQRGRSRHVTRRRFWVLEIHRMAGRSLSKFDLSSICPFFHSVI